MSTLDPPYDTIFAISNYVQDIIWVIVIIFELLTVIFFGIEFTRKTSNFRTSYYIMLTIGLAVDVFCQTLTLRKYIVANTDIGDLWNYIESSSSFYLAIYSDVWNITLILNRCTAIWFTFYSSRVCKFLDVLDFA
uniref:Uncharacterized protein n=1 Tax=Panagrolaimus superbus TaxID=310955 RepID=A0A914YAV0_9BILA